MEALLVNVKIISALALWIMATYGYGQLGIRALQRFVGYFFYKGQLEGEQNIAKVLLDVKFNFLFKGIMGVVVLSIISGGVHFFFPLNATFSIVFLAIGLGLFVLFFKRELAFVKMPLHWGYMFIAFSLAFYLASVLSIRVESAYDSGLYHIQAIKWLQEFPITFGIANIHTRLGYNNILYNFAALSEVSQIFPHIRSFICNEIVAFFFFFSGFLSLYNLRTKRLNDIFMSVGLLIVAMEFWWLGGGLYAEGILGILGISLVGYMIFILEHRGITPASQSANVSPMEGGEESFCKSTNDSSLCHVFGKAEESLPKSLVAHGNSSPARRLRHDNKNESHKEVSLAHKGFMPEEFTRESLATFALLFVIAFFSIYIKISSVVLLVCVLFVHFQYYAISKASSKNALLLCVFGVGLGVFWALKGICISGMVAYPAKVLHISALPWAVDEQRRVAEVMSIHNWAKVAGSPNRAELLADYSWLKVWNKIYISGVFRDLLRLLGYALAFLALFIGLKYLKLSAFKPYFPLICALILGVVFWFISAPDPRFGFQYFFPLIALFLSFVVSYFLNHKEHYLLGLLFLYICASLSIKHLEFKAIDKREGVKIPNDIVIESAYTNSHLLVYYPLNDDRVYDAPLPAAAYFNPKLSKTLFLGRDMYFIESYNNTE